MDRNRYYLYPFGGRWVFVLVCLYALLALPGCRKDELVFYSEENRLPIDPDPDAEIIGMYLLNEGNMGSNKSTLDYLDFEGARYVRNIYAERNPNVVKELGDVGNDIQIYGGRLYAVINCSHKVEVMDAYTAVRIGQVEIPNCRYIRFRGDRAYVSSYVGPVALDPNAPLGAVYEFDTATLKVTRRCQVGYQPDELAFVGDRLFVANSGGYRVDNYDNTVSEVDVGDMRQVRRFPVAINLHRLRADQQGQIWVSSRGDYKNIPSLLVCLARRDESAPYLPVDTLHYACTNMTMYGDSMLFYATEYSKITASNTITYGIINTKTHKLISSNFITDGSHKKIEIPYGIAVHPLTRDIFVTDAKNYVSSGTLHCYSPEGKLKWSVRTGDIPAHMVFLYRKK